MEELEMETKVKSPQSLRLIWRKVRHNQILWILVYCLAGLHTMSIWGYLPSILTTLEKRFELTTQKISSIFIFAEISTITFSALLSYYGGDKHRPRLMAIGLFVWGAAMFVIILPHIIYDQPNSENAFGAFVNSSSSEKQIKLACAEAINKTCSDDSSNMKTSSVVSLFLMSLGIFTSNAGVLALANIGASYVDDNVPKENTGLVLGFFAVARQIGYICGIFYASIFLSFYQDPFVDPGYDDKDERWIGAWWIGFIVAGVQCFIVGILMGIFPKNLKPREKPDLPNNVNELAAEGANGENLWKELPSRFKKLCKNKVFMANVFSASFAMFSLYGSNLMLPKAFETMFFMTPTEANNYTGYINIASFGIGFLAAGMTTKIFKPSPLKLSVFITSAFLLNAVMTFSIEGITCGSPAIKKQVLSSEPKCLHECDCSNFQFNPICDEERGITYFSPCHANCQKSQVESDSETYGNCGCVVGNYSMEFDKALKGVCKLECKAELYVFIILLTIIYALWACTAIIGALISLRIVSKSDKTFGQGVALSFLAILSFLPSPVIFSVFVDNSCAIWDKMSCESSNSYCLSYDYSQFRDSIHSLGGAGYIVAALFAAFASYHIRNVKDFYEDES